MGIAGGMVAEDGTEAINRRVNEIVLALGAEVRPEHCKDDTGNQRNAEFLQAMDKFTHVRRLFR